MTPRQQQIIGAMTGRQAAQVNDATFQQAVRSKLIELAQIAGKPLAPTSVGGIVAKVLAAAAKTIIFESEVPIALEMGAAGELRPEPQGINQTNCARWIVAYSCGTDRRTAQEYITLQSARDRARADAVSRDELRAEYEVNGLRRAWEAFLQDESWTFRSGYASRIYKKLSKDAVRALLTRTQMADAKTMAADCARAQILARTGRRVPADELERTQLFDDEWRAHIVRAYFETLRDRGLDIDWKPCKMIEK